MKRLLAVLFVFGFFATVSTSHLLAMDPSPNVGDLSLLKNKVYIKFIGFIADKNPKSLCIHIRELVLLDEYKSMKDEDLSDILLAALKHSHVNKLADIRSQFLDTPLHFACRFGGLRTISIFLEATRSDAECDELLMMRDDSGKTVLHEAATAKRVDIVRILVNKITKSKRAEFINIKDYIHMVNPVMFKFIVEEEFLSMTALDYARFWQTPEIVKILEDALQ